VPYKYQFPSSGADGLSRALQWDGSEALFTDHRTTRVIVWSTSRVKPHLVVSAPMAFG